jgi:hypothetical protein
VFFPFHTLFSLEDLTMSEPLAVPTETQEPLQKPRQPRAGKTKERYIRVCVKPTCDAPGVIRISIPGQEAIDYLTKVLDCQFGQRAFTLKKVGTNAGRGEEYDVLLDGANSSCTCLGFARWSRCKHVAGLQVLSDRGLI